MLAGVPYDASKVPWEAFEYTWFAEMYGWTPDQVKALPLYLRKQYKPVSDVLARERARREQEAINAAKSK
jgi:hypothetical protein